MTTETQAPATPASQTVDVEAIRQSVLAELKPSFEAELKNTRKEIEAATNERLIKAASVLSGGDVKHVSKDEQLLNNLVHKPTETLSALKSVIKEEIRAEEQYTRREMNTINAVISEGEKEYPELSNPEYMEDIVALAVKYQSTDNLGLEESYRKAVKKVAKTAKLQTAKELEKASVTAQSRFPMGQGRFTPQRTISPEEANKNYIKAAQEQAKKLRGQ